MKKTSIFPRLFPQLVVPVALSLLITLSLPGTLAAEGTITTKEVSEILPNVTYTNTVAEHSGGRVESFTLTAAPSSTLYPITIQGSGSIYGGGTIQNAVAKAEALGYNVIGGINSDYFSLSTGVPMGIVIEDGIYKSSPSQYSSILFNGNDTTILGPMEVTTTLTNARNGRVAKINHFNKHRADTGGVYLYNSDFSSVSTYTSTEGVMVRLVPTYDQLQAGTDLTVNSTLTLTVLEVLETSDPWDIGANDYILTSANESGYAEVLLDFAVGDTVTLSTSTGSAAMSNAQWATGGGDIMVSNGTMTNSANWVHTYEGRAPRSAMGVKADGSLVYYVVDGRQSGYSAGLSQEELANHLLAEGCIWAVNLDGGGSTSFSLAPYTAPHVFGSPALVNSPSDGRTRSCATFLLFVDPQIPTQVTLNYEEDAVLVGSHISLGNAYARDVNSTIVEKLNNTSLDALQNLGTLGSAVDSDGCAVYHYTPLDPGTEEFFLVSNSYGFENTQTLNIVDSLTKIVLTLEDTTAPLTEYQVSKEQTVDFSFLATYQGEPENSDGTTVTWDVFANDDAVLWEIFPGLEADPLLPYGTITQEGVFTAANQDAIVQVTAGGVTSWVNITVRTMFDDVPDDHWAFDAIAYLRDNELVKGISTTQFGLGSEIRRSDFVVMLYTALGSPSFTSYPTFSDVTLTDYYAAAIAWAVENNISAGMGDGTFGTHANVTREQAMAILYRTAESLGANLPTASLGTLAKYADGSNVTAYAQPAVAALTSQSIITDSTTLLLPQTALVRESMALYLYHLLTYAEQPTVAPSQLALYPTEITLAPGDRYSLTPLLEPAGTSAILTWTSSDPTAVSVSSTGTVTNIFTGTGQPVVTITAKTGSLTATCIVRCVAEGTEIPSIPPYVAPDITPEIPDVTPPEEDTTPDTTPEEDTTQPDTTPEEDTTQPDTTPEEDTTDPDSNTGIVINAPGGLNVRSAGNSSASVVTQIPQGTIVTIHSKTEDNWFQISCQVFSEESNMTSNIQGYVMGSYIQEQVISGTVVGADVGLNLRAGAGTAFDIIAKIPNDSKVTVLQAFTDWYQIGVLVEGEYLEGFVSSSYISLD